MERRVGRIFGMDYQITLLHSAIITLGGAALAYMALLLAVLVLPPREMLAAILRSPAAGWTMNLVNIAGLIILLFTSLAFMFDVARSRRLREQGPRIAILLLMPTVIMSVAVAATAKRAPVPHEVMRSVIIGVALLLSTLSLAKIVARQRRPYDSWLTLDIAE
jgi:hypothetical protein